MKKFLTTATRVVLAANFAVTGLDALMNPENHRERARVAEPIAQRFGIELSDSMLDISSRVLGGAYIVAAAGLALGVRAAGPALAALQIPVTLANYPVWQEGRDLVEDLGGIGASLTELGVALKAGRS